MARLPPLSRYKLLGICDGQTAPDEADRCNADHHPHPPSSDDFEVSIFLTETSTRHSLLYKHKHFRDTTQTKLTSNSAKLTGESQDAPIDVDNQADVAALSAVRERQGEDGTTPVQILREEDDDDEVVPLHDIPLIDRDATSAAAESAPSPPVMRSSKRRRGLSGPAIRYNSDGAELDGSAGNSSQGAGSSGANANANIQEVVVEDSDDEDGLFVQQSDNDESDAEARLSVLTVDAAADDDEDYTTTAAPPPAKRRKTAPEEAQRDDKKKLAMDISYEGFSIYGRVLCLVVKRRDGYASGKGKSKAVATTSAATTARGERAGESVAPGGQAVMENWITSTQMPADAIAE